MRGTIDRVSRLFQCDRTFRQSRNHQTSGEPCKRLSHFPLVCGNVEDVEGKREMKKKNTDVFSTVMDILMTIWDAFASLTRF